MYRDVLPKMKSLMEAIGDRKEPIWPECFGYRFYDQIALEDLKVGEPMIEVCYWLVFRLCFVCCIGMSWVR